MIELLAVEDKMKTTYRYNWKSGEWDHVIHDFMVRGLTLVTTPNEPHYPSKVVSDEFRQAQRKRNFETAAMVESAALRIQSYS